MTGAVDLSWSSVTAWYDATNEQYQDLYDELCDRIEHFNKFDIEQVLDFLSELSDLGIDNKDQFSDAFYTFSSEASYRAEREFAEEFCVECGMIDEDSPVFFAIDWQHVWDGLLRYDFSTIVFDGDTYFFNNEF